MTSLELRNRDQGGPAVPGRLADAALPAIRGATPGSANPTKRTMNLRPLFRSGIVLGLGLGGFIDGIVLHQILGWHHLVCTTATCQPESIAALQRQNTQDGLFHLAVLLLTIAGVALLHRVRSAARNHPQSGRILFAGAIAGWGLFNVVEGLIDHHLLGLHHVRPDSPHWLAWDLGFLAFGCLLILIGWRLWSTRTAEEAAEIPQPVT